MLAMQWEIVLSLVGEDPTCCTPTPPPQKTQKTYSRAELLVTGYVYTFSPEINISKTSLIGV